MIKQNIFSNVLKNKKYFNTFDQYQQYNKKVMKAKQVQQIGLQSEHRDQTSEGELAKMEDTKMKQLEGSLKIVKFVFIRKNYKKSLFFMILLTISVLGLFFLKYYKRLRVFMFYDQLTNQKVNQATHVYVRGSDKSQSICKINRIESQEKENFIFKFLKYQYCNDNVLPIGLRLKQFFGQYAIDRLKQAGLSNMQVQKSRQKYGKNEHKVDIPNYFTYLFTIMRQPFFIFQYITSFIYILQNVAAFAALMIIFGIITASVNYILLYFSFKNIKQAAEKTFKIKVKRDRLSSEVQSNDIVCGDVFFLQEEGQIPCDSLLLQGQVFVDESSLTGESAPIRKSEIENEQNINSSNHWLYEGSKVLKINGRAIAMAVNIGFCSRRGQMIRKIITKVPNQPQFFKKLIYFLIQVMLVSFIIYGATISMMLRLDIEPIMIIFRILDFITYSFPAGLPIFFNIAYSFCLWRLHRDQISGTQCEKAIQSARIKTLCFDKTGTLTQRQLRVQKIYTAKTDEPFEECNSNTQVYPLVRKIFSCCNNIQLINNQYKGDQIDEVMFNRFSARIAFDQIGGERRYIQVEGDRFQVLKVHQYQSRYQQMSVLVEGNGKYYIFAKGTPQKLCRINKKQIKIKGFLDFVNKKSLEGCRTIAFGYLQIEENQVDHFMRCERNEFLRINIIGIVTFASVLKQDVEQTMRTLNSCDINTKIITGDNIFLAAQTALKIGIIPSGKIQVIEGKQWEGKGKPLSYTQLRKLDNGVVELRKLKVENFQFSYGKDNYYAVDNQFIQMNLDSFQSVIRQESSESQQLNLFLQNMKVFARITPENKALIVRKHKEAIASKINSRTFCGSIFGETSLKVGMVGDGANDLIAIKEADVGIGISNTDAQYSASFTVKELKKIPIIIKEGKNTQRQIVDMAQFFGIANFLSVTSTIILTLDSSFNTSNQLIYKNFAIVLASTLFFAFSRPAASHSKYLPNSNFMGIQNHLVFWSSCLMLSGGQIWAYLYYYNTNDFVSNPSPKVTFSSGWNGACKSATANFLITILEFTFLPLIIYRSAPWKQPFYKNILLTVLFIFNVVMIFPFYFSTQSFASMDLQPIGRREAGIMLAIAGVFCLGCGAINVLIDCAGLHERINYNEEANNSQTNINIGTQKVNINNV